MPGGCPAVGAYLPAHAQVAPPSRERLVSIAVLVLVGSVVFQEMALLNTVSIEANSVRWGKTQTSLARLQICRPRVLCTSYIHPPAAAPALVGGEDFFICAGDFVDAEFCNRPGHPHDDQNN